jgi:hypothetical protein
VKPGLSHEENVSSVCEDEVLDDGGLVYFRGDCGSGACVAEGYVEVVRGRRARIRIYISGK